MDVWQLTEIFALTRILMEIVIKQIPKWRTLFFGLPLKQIITFMLTFFRVVDGFIVLFDENNYFCSGTTCLSNIYSRLSEVPSESSNNHEDCIDIICTFIQERVSREIRSEYIF